MNINKLQFLLKELSVPDEMYNLNGIGRDDERFCLRKTEQQWQVYFSERGVKTINEMFDTESAACQYIFEQLKD